MASERVRVLIAGGGVAGLEVMLALHKLAAELVHVELLAPQRFFSYKPLAVLEPFDAGHAHRIELRRLGDEVGATVTPGALMMIDIERNLARTSTGDEIPFDVLVLAQGALPRPALAGALTFRGPADADAFRALLAELETGSFRRLAFVQPGAVAWTLPLYELALLTADHLAQRGIGGAELIIVTGEGQPLSLFGQTATESLLSLLEERAIQVLAGREAIGYDGETLTVEPPPPLHAERVVTLPKLEGHPLEGIPRDPSGFVPVDEFGRVDGLPNVFAAGDCTTFPIKQGGLAAQAADAVAETIAAEAGASIAPTPFHPVLRGLLLTGATPAFLRADLTASGADAPIVSAQPLWWPPAKIVGRYLAPVLARTLHYGETAPPAGGIPVQVDLSSD